MWHALMLGLKIVGLGIAGIVVLAIVLALALIIWLGTTKSNPFQ